MVNLLVGESYLLGQPSIFKRDEDDASNWTALGTVDISSLGYPATSNLPSAGIFSPGESPVHYRAKTAAAFSRTPAMLLALLLLS